MGRTISHLTMVGLPGIITPDNFLYVTTDSSNKYFLRQDDFFNSRFPRIQCVSCFTGLLKIPLTFNLNNRTVKVCSVPKYGVFTCVLCTSCTDGHIHTYCFNQYCNRTLHQKQKPNPIFSTLNISLNRNCVLEAMVNSGI